MHSQCRQHERSKESLIDSEFIEAKYYKIVKLTAIYSKLNSDDVEIIQLTVFGKINKLN